MRTFAFLLFSSLLSVVAMAQNTEAAVIILRNPSFEDMPRNSMPPIGWTDCGWPTETAPDVQPDPLNQFRVTMRPQDGNTYLGMVVRDNDTWERVGQELSEPLVGGQCYAFRIQLARSKVYLSQSRVKNQPANYVTPTKLRVHGGYDLCDRMEIIGETELVTNYDWKEYTLKLRPEEDFTHILLEVYYKTPSLIPYNGNLLLDNASPLIPVACDETVPTVSPEILAENPPPPPETIEPVQINDSVTKSPVTPSTPAPRRYKLGQTMAPLKVDAVFQIDNITFKANSDELEPSSEQALDEILLFLKQNAGVTIEIGGHASSQASSQFAMQISRARAESVVEYLRTHGVAPSRLYPNGYGKSRRVCAENTAECRRRNQRVEVKILRME